MKFSLRTKLTFSYIMVTLISVSLISIITNLLLDKHFKEYIIQNQARKSEEIVSLIGQRFEAGKGWDLDVIEDICINALEQGMIIKVTDDSQKIIWDARLHDNALCEDMIAHMEQNMSERYPDWEGGYAEDTYPVTNKFGNVGNVIIGYYGPYFFNDSDLQTAYGCRRFFSYFILILWFAYVKKTEHTYIKSYNHSPYDFKRIFR